MSYHIKTTGEHTFYTIQARFTHAERVNTGWFTHINTERVKGEKDVCGGKDCFSSSGLVHKRTENYGVYDKKLALDGIAQMVEFDRINVEKGNKKPEYVCEYRVVKVSVSFNIESI